MIRFNGYVWDNLKDACCSLGLDYNDVLKWQREHPTLRGAALLSHYIKYHRIITKGLIFDNFDAACRSWGVNLSMIKPYLAVGIGFDLACYMALNGYKPNLFNNINKIKNK